MSFPLGPSGPVKVKPVIGAPRCPEFGLNSSLPRVGPRIGGTVDFHHDARFWGCEGAPFIKLRYAVARTISVLCALRLHCLRVLVCPPFPRAFRTIIHFSSLCPLLLMKVGAEPSSMLFFGLIRDLAAAISV